MQEMPCALLLRDSVFRAFLASNMAERFAAAAMTVLLGFQVYGLTHNPLDLAWLGLIERPSTWPVVPARTPRRHGTGLRGSGRLLPQCRAGQTLLAVIAGFGVSVVVFGLSRSLPLSLAALFVAALCDGASMVIRRAILQLASPEGVHGRIAAVKSVFVGSSNELGAFESEVAASLLRASAAVWGGLVPLGIVAGTAWLAPRLWQLDLVGLAQAGPAAISDRSRSKSAQIS